MRPTKFDDIIGQKESINRVKIMVESAKKRNTTLSHLLFNGPPGTGKTTIATSIANEMGAEIQLANGGNLKKIKNILPYLSKLQLGSILFIDEIHSMSLEVAEFIYTCMEDFRMDIGSKNGGPPLSVPLKRFTLIGATTELGRLPKPLLDRFTSETLTLYEPEDLSTIIIKNAQHLKLNITDDAALNLAKRCMGTPRIAVKYLEWVRDYALSKNTTNISPSLVYEAMDVLDIDERGLGENHRKYLNKLYELRRPVGLKEIESSINVDRETILNQIEPILLQLGLLHRTPKGRVAVEPPKEESRT